MDIKTPTFDETQPIDAGTQGQAPSFEETQPLEKFQTTGEQIKAGLEGFAKGLAGPVATGAETLLFNNAAEQEARASANPVTHYATEAAGLVAPAIVTGGASVAARMGLQGASKALPALSAASKFTQAGMLEKAAHAASEAIGLGGEGANLLSRVGSAAVKGAIENAGFQAGDEVSRQILHPDFSKQAVSAALFDVGGAALIGGGLGGGIGSAAELWKAKFGGQTTGILKALVDKAGGHDGVVSDPVHEAIGRLGIGADVPPEIMAAMSSDPEIKQIASVLNQSDVTKSGLKYQNTVKDFHKKLDEHMVRALGKDPEAITKDFSKYEQGQKIGSTLADEYHEKMGPVSDAYDATSAKYSKTELGQSLEEKKIESANIQADLNSQLEKQTKIAEKALKSGDVETAVNAHEKINDLQSQILGVQNAEAVPGVKDIVSQKLAQLVEREGWEGSEDIMKEINRLNKRIPNLKTIADLQKEMTTVGNNTAPKIPGMHDPVSRSGGLIKLVLRDAEATAIGRAIGSEEGVAALEEFNANRRNFAQVAKLKDALDERLRTDGTATNYAKSIRLMAQNDAEAVFKRLSGAGDADLLKFITEHFPRTAKAVKEARVDMILSDAAKNAPGKSLISGKALSSAIDDLSPELRDFAIPADATAKLAAIDSIKAALSDSTHNFSNTTRTIPKLLGYMPGAAMGMMTALISHNPAAALLVGGLTKTIMKDAPDAIRLALLKFLGSNKPIESGAFKAAVDFIHSTIKGENAAVKATKNVFMGGSEVISSAMIPTVTERDKIDKKVKSLQQNPEKMLDPDKIDHYLPDHAGVASGARARVVTYLNQIRPQPKQAGPLDSKIEPGKAEMAAYDRALDIAQQPLVVLQHIKDGTLLPSDVGHLKSMYPEAYDNIAGKLMHQMTDYVSKGEHVPYSVRQGLSMFFGEPLDGTMTPQAIQSIQASLSLNKPDSQQPQGGTKKGTSKLGEIAKSAQTPEQSREARRNKA